MSDIKGFWFEPGCTYVLLVREVEEPWGQGNGGGICPPAFLKRYPGSRLFFRGHVAKNGYYRVFFYNPEFPEVDDCYYWVPPQVLVKMT